MNPFHRQALRRRLQTDPYYRFESAEEVAIAAEWGLKLDVNQATVDDWLRLPGLSIHQARQLVALTQSGLQFLCPEDLAAALNCPVNRLRPWIPLLDFIYNDPTSTPTSLPINHITLEQLTQLPNLPPAIATAILQERDHHGPYRHLADLQQRVPLTPELLENLLHYVRF